MHCVVLGSKVASLRAETVQCAVQWRSSESELPG